MKNIRTNKGITLIALVITIIVLLILAGISIVTLTGENGTLNNAQKAKFKTNVAKYKEQIALNSFVLDDNSIKGLKQQLELQKGALEQAKQNCEKGIEWIELTENNLYEVDDILQNILMSFVEYANSDKAEQKREELKQNTSSKISKWNEIILNINENNSYIINFGNKYFQQGNIKIEINDLHWEKLYGKEEIDYDNIDAEIEKMHEIGILIGQERSRLGAKHTSIEYAKSWLESQETSLETLYQNIFGTNKEEVSEEQAIQKATSWKTTTNFFDIIQVTYDYIEALLLARIDELIEMAENTSNVNVAVIQTEVDEIIKEIERELTYTQAGNKKLLDGSFPVTPKINLETLEIQGISVMSEQERNKAKSQVAGALKKIRELKNDILNKKTVLQDKQDEEADKGYAFEIDNTKTTPMVEIEEKDKDKFQIVNGELTYIGNNQNEKQWALEMEIKVP